ncbi:DNA-binding protein [Skermanella stibiiresistens SB22]|uniref:DNA-binding protein n=1 Tax=Skermanella stibiiresistens SB22 TaxID=1385369 RepID=W9H579_9PROT|nr:PPC domain-containing DNA-binding protein [Skermanella stibiiresistens]EWY41184.1 DNA-binding protein [Skermanella stibiiresistens SB22]
MTDASPPRHIETPTGYLMVLRQGDDLFARLEALMRDRQVPSASFVGFGFAGKVTFGFYDFDRKRYDPKTYRNLELTNMTGTLAWKDGEPSVHAHGVAGDKTFATVGGHLLGLTVGTGSLEITITVHGERLNREVDPSIGANVLSLSP